MPLGYHLILFVAIYLFTSPFSNLAFGQEDSLGLNIKYSPEALKEDFTILKSSLEDLHIGLYNYTPKIELDKVFQQVESKLNREMTVLEFFEVLSILNLPIGNVHTKITPPSKMWSALKQEMPVFPFKVYWHQNQLYLFKNLSNQADIPEGSMIKSINGQDANEVFKKMTQLMNRDGYNQSYPVHRSCVSFDHIYAAFFGRPKNFELTLETPNGKSLKVKVKALKKADSDQNYLARYKKTNVNWERTEEPALVLKFEQNLAILQVKTFQESLIKEKGQKYKAFFKKAFKEIQQKGIQNLVLDIRGNSGGQPEPTELLLSYLLKNPFQLCTKIEAKVEAIPDKTHFIRNGSIDFFEDRSWEKKGATFMLTDKSQFRTWEPKKNRFKGRLFFLIDGFTNSAAGTFAGQIKSQNRATIVGEETGGNPNLTVARIIPKLELPNSKIVISLPMIQSTKKVSFKNTGHGVVPDQIIRPSTQDLIQGKDVVLDWVRLQMQAN